MKKKALTEFINCPYCDNNGERVITTEPGKTKKVKCGVCGGKKVIRKMKKL